MKYPILFMRRLAGARHLLPCAVLALLAAVSLFALTSLLRVSALHAQELSSDRPDFTESASVVRRAQLETGYTFERSATTSRHAFGEALLRLGLGERLELRLGVNSFVMQKDGNHQDSGLDDISVGTKIGLSADHVALILTAALPTGSAALDAGHGVSPEVLLAVERSLNARADFATNVSIASIPGALGRNTALSASAVVGIAASEKTGLFAEVYGTRMFGGVALAREHSSYADMGMTRAITADLQLDARAGIRLNKGSEWFVGVGMVRRWR